MSGPSRKSDSRKQAAALYREQIIDHYRRPRNFGSLPACDVRHRESNFSCGDDLEFHIKVKDGKVADLKFKGQGCALSVAAASMLTEKAIGLSVKGVMGISEQDVIDMLGVGPLSGSRLRCACLGLKGIQQALSGISETGKPKRKIRRK